MLTGTKVKLASQLTIDEGIKYVVYDDATGKPITKGDTLQGYPTIGVGRRLDFPCGITWKESDSMLSDDIDSMDAACTKAFSWYDGLTENRKAAICNICFNMGIKGFEGFSKTIAAIEARDWQGVKDNLLDSVWASQVHERATRIAGALYAG